MTEIQKKTNDLSPVLELIAALVNRAIMANFEARGRWNGDENDISIFSGGSQRWRPLSAFTKALYKRRGWELEPTLNRTKGLMSTIEVRPDGKSSILISANSSIAQIHQEGGKEQRKIPLTREIRGALKDIGSPLAKAKSRYWEFEAEMPARPYISLTPEDLEEILDVILRII